MLTKKQHIATKINFWLTMIAIFAVREEVSLNMLVSQIVKSSAIEVEKLKLEEARSSITRQLGIEQGGYVSSSRHVDGLVEMLLDATQHYQ